MNTEKFLMKKAKENLSTLESTVIYFSLWRRWLYVYFLNSSLDIVAKICQAQQKNRKAPTALRFSRILQRDYLAGVPRHLVEEVDCLTTSVVEELRCFLSTIEFVCAATFAR